MGMGDWKDVNTKKLMQLSIFILILFYTTPVVKCYKNPVTTERTVHYNTQNTKPK